MKQILKEQHLALLKEVIVKRCPQLTGRVESADISGLFQGERLVIIDALGNELMASGLDKNCEPTSRGLQIEALIDIINLPNLGK